MRNKRVLIWIVIILSLAGCAGFIRTPSISKSGPDIRGVITDLTEVKRTGVIVIRVVGEKFPGAVSDQADVAIKAGTKIFVESASRFAPGSKADLAVGQEVEAIFIGPIAERYPVAATAEEVIIKSNP